MPLEGKRAVSIVGFCETSRNQTPYDDPAMEVWGLNRGYLFMKRADRWFEMHGKHIWSWENRRPGDHASFLAKFPGPVYMHQKFPEIPNCVEYPLVEVANDLFPNIVRIKPDGTRKPGNLWPYLGSSITQEIALAIHEKFESIHLYGVDLNTDSEYAFQKPSVEALLGIAVGRGIEVVIPDNCPLWYGTIYGRGFMSPSGETMSYEQLQSRMEALRLERDRASQELFKVQGAIEALKEVITQMPPGLDAEKVENRNRFLMQKAQDLSVKLERLQGSLKETAYWQSMTPKGQDPQEAIEQLTKLDGEGPVSDIDAIQRTETMFSALIEAERVLAGVK